MIIGLLSAAARVAAEPQPDQPSGPRGGWPARVAAIDKAVAAEYASLEKLYKYLHQHPELSYHEKDSAARMARELKALGFAVTENVGGYGVVGVLKNGKGPTVLVRTDMDALPVTEATGLPYASRMTARGNDGKEVGVMHACGHDMHMS
jgi:hippurate hydrolase